MVLTSLWVSHRTNIFHSVHEADIYGNDEHETFTRGEIVGECRLESITGELFSSGILQFSSAPVINKVVFAKLLWSFTFFISLEFFMRNHLITRKNSWNWKIVYIVSALVMELCFYREIKWQQIGVNPLIYICPIRCGVCTQQNISA